MNKISIVKSVPILLIGLIISKSGYPDSLDEIASFAERMCNDVRVEGEISRLEIKGRLEGNSGFVAKLVGAEIEGDASLTQKKDVFNNLPLDELSEQFRDARECKKELATLLIKERNKNESLGSSGVKPWHIAIGAVVIGILASSGSSGSSSGSNGGFSVNIPTP